MDVGLQIPLSSVIDRVLAGPSNRLDESYIRDAQRLATEFREARTALRRVAATVKDMKARAEDNPDGLQAETVSMFADELDVLAQGGN